MLVEFLSVIFCIFNILLIILIVMQKNHGGFWSGPAGNDSVVIFGGNQGADVLQKITWVFGFFLIFGCLSLSIYQTAESQKSQFYLEEVKENLSKIESNEKTDIVHNENKTEDEIEKNSKDSNDLKSDDSEILEVKKSNEENKSVARDIQDGIEKKEKKIVEKKVNKKKSAVKTNVKTKQKE